MLPLNFDILVEVFFIKSKSAISVTNSSTLLRKYAAFL